MDKARKSSASRAEPYAAACGLCHDADPNARHRHYLALFRECDAEGLRQHLATQYVDLRPLERQRPDTVQDVITWCLDLREQWKGYVDPHTGAPLDWEEARQIAATQAAAPAKASSARPRSGAVKVLVGRLAPLLQRYPAGADRAWAALHLDLMQQGLVRRTPEALQAQAVAYRMFGQKYPVLAALCGRLASEREEEAARLEGQPAPQAEDEWAPYMTAAETVPTQEDDDAGF